MPSAEYTRIILVRRSRIFWLQSRILCKPPFVDLYDIIQVIKRLPHLPVLYGKISKSTLFYRPNYFTTGFTTIGSAFCILFPHPLLTRAGSGIRRHMVRAQEATESI